MFGYLWSVLFGDEQDKLMHYYASRVKKINSLETRFSEMSDEDLKNQTEILKNEINQGKTADDILEVAFALVREAAKRTIKLRHYDVQLMGGMALHEGRIAEMDTGEGKTLVATLAAYLNALFCQHVHIVTVNDYLAQRDANWMRPIYEFLGLTVGFIDENMPNEERKKEYQSNVLYVTSRELGFDYLKDNLKTSQQEIAQSKLAYAIVDEVDSILIDEARTPLVISGLSNILISNYQLAKEAIKDLEAGDYEVDEKRKTVYLTDNGISKLETILQKKEVIAKNQSLYSIENVEILHQITQALKAKHVFLQGQQYLVKHNKVLIIDEFTGRISENKRFSNGLHQALEAKENVPINPEQQTIGSITVQNFFRMYDKISGMTGTAKSEAEEFSEIYGLKVVSIPPHMTRRRTDHDDEVYRNKEGKYKAMIQLIKEKHALGQPILVGTSSVSQSSLISDMLKKDKIPHNILDAKHHEQEAKTINQAGERGKITIVANMAGRGTDIQLGGNSQFVGTPNSSEKPLSPEHIKAEREKIVALGGLLVISAERNESRRVDNQLRGRCARQGDPGETKFFISLEDDLMRIFSNNNLDSMLEWIGVTNEEAITHPWITKAIEKSQGKLETYNYELRKNLLKYDNIMNEQRLTICQRRREIICQDNVDSIITDLIHETFHALVEECLPEDKYRNQWDIERLTQESERLLAYKDLPIRQWVEEEGISNESIVKKLEENSNLLLTQRRSETEPALFQRLQKEILISIIDTAWCNHLHALETLKQTVYLKAYGQKRPFNEYEKGGFELFNQMLTKIADQAPALIHKVLRQGVPVLKKPEAPKPQVIEQGVSRNKPCPCGSKLKYKHCHGKLA